jgi:mono/diheme cytochrome c family protein
MKPARYAVLLLPAVIAVGGVWYFVSRGFSARTPPSSAEAFVARHLRRLAVPGGVEALKNPVALTSEVLHEAMEHFADHCAFCHGADGSGQTQIGKGLYPPPPDMRTATTQQMSDGEIYSIIRNGVRFTGMPAFSEESGEPDPDSWKLVLFIRHLPQMKPEEIEHMESMLPKSPMELQQQEEIQRFLNGEDKPH